MKKWILQHDKIAVHWCTVDASAIIPHKYVYMVRHANIIVHPAQVLIKVLLHRVVSIRAFAVSEYFLASGRLE